MGSRSNRPVFLCFAAAALFGASTPLSKILLRSVGSFSLAGLLYLGAAIAVAPLAIRSGWPGGRLRSRNLMRLAGVVLCGGILGPALLLLGLSRASAGSVALWLNLEVAATALLAWALFRENLSGRSWLALILVGAASIVLAAPAGFEAGAGAALVGLACVCWGLDNNLTALIDGLTPAQTTMIKGLVAGGFNLSLGIWLDRRIPPAGVVAPALLVGAIGYGLSLLLYIGGSQELGAARAQMIFASAPFWGVTIAWTLLGEPILRQQLVAGGLGLAALWLLHAERHEHEHTHDEVEHRHWHRHDDGHHEHAHPGLPKSVGHDHQHTHARAVHTHPHRPDLQHRHGH
jgi:drug/metabolite transporter (DMT)-like permease